MFCLKEIIKIKASREGEYQKAQSKVKQDIEISSIEYS